MAEFPAADLALVVDAETARPQSQGRQSPQHAAGGAARDTGHGRQRHARRPRLSRRRDRAARRSARSGSSPASIAACRPAGCGRAWRAFTSITASCRRRRWPRRSAPAPAASAPPSRCAATRSSAIGGLGRDRGRARRRLRAGRGGAALGRRGSSCRRYLVDNVIAEPSLAALFRHELRWARTIRLVAPGGFAGSVVTQPVVLAALGRRAGRAAVACAWPMLAAALVVAAVSRCAALDRILGLAPSPLHLAAGAGPVVVRGVCR